MNRPIEEWRRIRALVEKGLSLNQAAKQFGLSFSHLQRRAAVEGWKLHGRGRPRTMDYPDGTRRVEMAKEQARRDAQQAELLLEARVAVFDTKKAELVAQKILAQHSTRMKVALSELVVQTAEDLRSSEVRPKDRALAMVALKTVCDRLFGWDREPDMRATKLARTSNRSQDKSYYEHWLEGTEPPECTGAVNLALIATTPEQLAEMAGRKADRDGHSRPSATESNDLSIGSSPVASEQSKAAGDGHPSPVKLSVQARCETTLHRMEKTNRGDPPAGHPLPDTDPKEPPPTPGSQEWHRLRLEELAVERAKWRGWR